LLISIIQTRDKTNTIELLKLFSVALCCWSERK